jgi:hypothetical protein
VPGLMLVAKARSIPLALPIIIGLCWKGLPGTKTLACANCISKKIYNIGPWIGLVFKDTLAFMAMAISGLSWL